MGKQPRAGSPNASVLIHAPTPEPALPAARDWWNGWLGWAQGLAQGLARSLACWPTAVGLAVEGRGGLAPG